MAKAYLVKDFNVSLLREDTSILGNPHHKLFRCDPPLRDTRLDFSDEEDREYTISYEYVIASANTILGTPETYLFGADEEGRIVDWHELHGSRKGTLSHELVFEELGYEVVAECGQ